ncbi:acyl carrier protein [Catonella morbi ATCC 51271]|uniref:Acyl carrier protein n=1 Tax=Catonella morbi ATCC 51271 TaxID=592026 RepID=V2Y1R7_9FIRM|nr:acyl carrier protein [Catonella morbi]ESL02022.1 acyl carrier protein [Catonella morbi ATCC 51271]
MNFEKVKEVIVNAANIDEDKIKLSASLESDLGLDSLDAVELGMALEEEFGITIDEDKLASFKTVEDIVNFIDNAKED